MVGRMRSWSLLSLSVIVLAGCDAVVGLQGFRKTTVAASTGVGGSPVGGAGGGSSVGGAGGAAGAGGAGGQAIQVDIDCDSANLLFCYLFDGNLDDGLAGNPTPLSAKGENETVAFAPGVQGQALDIQPDNDVSAFQLNFGPTDFTFETWVLPRSFPPSNERVVLLDGNGVITLSLGDNTLTNAVRCKAGNGLNEPISLTGGFLAANRWTHVACVRTVNGNGDVRLEIFIDGAPEAVDTFVGPLNTTSFSGLTIGNNCCNGTDDFDGQIDNVRMFSIARSPQQLCEAAGRMNCPQR